MQYQRPNASALRRTWRHTYGRDLVGYSARFLSLNVLYVRSVELSLMYLKFYNQVICVRHAIQPVDLCVMWLDLNIDRPYSYYLWMYRTAYPS